MHLLIVGSLGGHITEAARIAMEQGAKVLQASSIDEAMKALRAGSNVHLVMADVALDVASLIEQIEGERITVPVVACGVSNDARAAVSAIRAGAQEYVPLPPNPELIAAVLGAVATEADEILYKDPTMDAVMRLAAQVAPAEASVLITGESGTGKELMARFLHARSNRADGPFVAVNCAAIPENLLESELFGHEKGAFTGAVARRIGKFEEANGGTILLDEISEMDIRLQAKLLRVIQEREVTRLGGDKNVKLNVRILATSNRNLEEYIREGSFREDLYFRLNVVNVRIPSLRDRPSDIQLLADHFLEKFCESNGLKQKTFSPLAIDKLQGHHWAGNCRELENTIHRAVLLSIGPEVEVDAIQLSGQSLGTTSTAEAQTAPDAPSIASTASVITANSRQGPSNGTGAGKTGYVGRTVADVERELIVDTLHHTFGNRTHAAQILGISIRTLRNKLKLYQDQGVNFPAPGEGDGDRARA
ncbi:MAG: sigma-54 dependent transcriptional regulator [Alphaproteobacteria bacterium]